MIVVVMDMQEGEDLMNKFYNGMEVEEIVVYRTRCGNSITKIAKQIGENKSGVSRELGEK
jgi:hypothetical protein